MKGMTMCYSVANVKNLFRGKQLLHESDIGDAPHLTCGKRGRGHIIHPWNGNCPQLIPRYLLNGEINFRKRGPYNQRKHAKKPY